MSKNVSFKNMVFLKNFTSGNMKKFGSFEQVFQAIVFKSVK